MEMPYKLEVLWCRTFQSVLKIGNYFMGYRMPKYLEGPGKIKELGTFLKEKGINDVLVVTGAGMVRRGQVQPMLDGFDANGIRYTLQTYTTTDPTSDDVELGYKTYKEHGCKSIVAIGGGSRIDCAKGIAAKVVHPRKTVAQLQGLLKVHWPIPPFVAIPTTSGAGSEVTNFAVITHDGVKTPLVDDALQPDMAILDGALLQNLPKSLIADAGFDVLAHALEAAVAKNAGGISGALARWAFSTGCEMLPRSFEGDLSARLGMHQAATAAAMAFSSAGLGLCHALSHSLGGLYHIPHGRLNAILLPAVIGANSGWGNYAPIARSSGMGGAADAMAVRSLKSGLISLRKRLRLPSTLTQAGVSAARLRTDTPAIIRGTLSDPCCSTNPRPVDEQLIRGILKEVSGAV